VKGDEGRTIERRGRGEVGARSGRGRARSAGGRVSESERVDEGRAGV
jgi:hypothetical protein